MPYSTDQGSALKGSLTTISIPKILQFFHTSGKVGVLALTNGKKKVHLHFDDGKLVFLTSNYFPEMSIGEYFVKNKIITNDVNQQSKQEIKKTRQKQGTWLMDHGHITPHQLYGALNEQAKQKLFTIFDWHEGEYIFREGEIVDQEDQVLDLNLAAIIYEGIRDRLDMQKMPREFKGRKESLIFKRTDAPCSANELPLSPTENRMYTQLITGKYSLRQVAHASKMKPKQAYKVLFALHMLGLIGFPEAVGMTKPGKKDIKELKKPEKSRKKKKTEDALSVEISDDVIKEAMASVDRIKQEVSHEEEFRDPSYGIEDDDVARLTKAAAQEPMPEEDPSFDPSYGLGRQVAKPAAATTPADISEDFSLGDKTPWGKTAQTQPVAPPPEPQEPEEPQEDADQGPDLDAMTPEELLEFGQDLIIDLEYLQAREVLEKAHELDPDFIDVYPLLGWAIFNTEHGPDKRNESEQLVKKALKARPNMWQAYLYLGKIYRNLGEDDFAELHFVKALEYNIDCEEARDEIKKIRSK